MNIDLSSVGMEKGQQYETIITTKNHDGKENASPFGIICKEKDKIICRIFKGSLTLKNISMKREFTVNIINDPLLFTLSTIDNLPEEYFIENSQIAILKDAEAYIKCRVTDIKEGMTHSDPIRKSPASIVKADVKEIIIKQKCVKAPNRGFYSLIESLVNFTRIDMVNEEKQKYFLNRFRESKRIINKVGSNEEKKAMKILQKTLENKGYKIKLE
ncbi:MAG: DUF447 family protein [Methanobacteriaceae archaeon]|jgi:hypothetical protein|nr:DUF447 family protein [Candidatus Methanorudis spinitermitis]